MVTKETRKWCDNCDKRTLHEVERNRETGWHRERCESCNLRETISPHNA